MRQTRNITTDQEMKAEEQAQRSFMCLTAPLRNELAPPLVDALAGVSGTANLRANQGILLMSSRSPPSVADKTNEHQDAHGEHGNGYRYTPSTRAHQTGSQG